MRFLGTSDQQEILCAFQFQEVLPPGSRHRVALRDSQGPKGIRMPSSARVSDGEFAVGFGFRCVAAVSGAILNTMEAGRNDRELSKARPMRALPNTRHTAG